MSGCFYFQNIIMQHWNLLPIASFGGLEEQCNRFGGLFVLFKQTSLLFTEG